MKGTIAWWELPVPDLDAAAAFYGPVFDWSFAPFGAGFTMITDSGGEMVRPRPRPRPRPHRPTGVRTYYPVDDLTATLASVTGHGGAVATEPELISEEFGWYAVGTDPFGNRIGLCSGNPPTT